jgi:putative spermidine/putrescine transport system ATP-binding protein
MAGDARAPDTVAPKAAPAGEPTPAAEPTPAGARTPTDERPALVLRDLRKVFGTVVACDDVGLEVRRGEFVTLLGPSGSGKTTTLRMVAGFTAPSGGTIEIDGRDMTRVPPHRRNVGMVFQNYALFPHMTAAQNIAFPLQMRGVPRQEQRDRVERALGLVKLEGFGDRYPRQLSGGQQQRIALARAVVFEPAVLLMDEPLGALDRKLREALQVEIMHVSRQIGATVLYVTHDQEEALVMSDRIAIFNKGRIEQLGDGEDLYDRPVSVFVADFIGDSNILRGTYQRDGAEGGFVTRESSRWRIGRGAAGRAALDDGAAAALVIRPERTQILAPTDAATPESNVVEATIDEVLYLGAERKYALRLGDGQRVAVREHRDGSERTWDRGDAVRLAWSVDDGILLADPAG